MSTFTTNNATRQGKRGRLGTLLVNTINNARVDSGAKSFSENLQNVAKEHQKTSPAFIGNNMANGLTILGTNEYDTSRGTNPTGRTPPSGEDTDEQGNNRLTNPDFPLTFSGRGTLAIKSVVKIPSMTGPTSIDGTLTVRSLVITDPSLLAIHQEEFFTPTIRDPSNNTFTLTYSKGTIISVDRLAMMVIHMKWDAHSPAGFVTNDKIIPFSIGEVPGTYLDSYMPVMGVEGMASDKISSQFLGFIEQAAPGQISLWQTEQSTYNAKSILNYRSFGKHIIEKGELFLRVQLIPV